MIDWLRNLTIGQAWGFCKTAMVFITPATIVWATAWPVAWTYVIAPAIAQVAEQTMADNIADLQAEIDKIQSSQANVGQGQNNVEASNKFLVDLLQYSLCVQVNPTQPSVCGPQPEAPP